MVVGLVKKVFINGLKGFAVVFCSAFAWRLRGHLATVFMLAFAWRLATVFYSFSIVGFTL